MPKVKQARLPNGRFARKTVVQHLGDEIEVFRKDGTPEETNEALTLLFSYNNCCDITNNNATPKELDNATDGAAINGHLTESTHGVTNGVVPATVRGVKRKGNKRRTSSRKSTSDEDVVEINSNASSPTHGVGDDQAKSEGMTREQICFMRGLGLITHERLKELQNKRAERKRRSTANPQYVYTGWGAPAVRKKKQQEAADTPTPCGICQRTKCL